MQAFKHFSDLTSFIHSVDQASVTFGPFLGRTLFLRFDKRDVLQEMAYQGPADIWFSSLCYLAQGKTIHELRALSWKDWDDAFRDDQFYWDLKAEKINDVFFSELELLKAAIDSYEGSEHLYRDQSPLICRCFSVRESDILDYLRGTEGPTPEGLTLATKASLGCRSCLPQLQRLFVVNSSSKGRFYKERPIADWIIEADYLLSCFPLAKEWNMELESFKDSQVVIRFAKDVTQLEEERVSADLQSFLGAALDSDLSFFLRRSRQR